MTTLLRRVDKKLWGGDNPEWLGPDDVPAERLIDFPARKNKLSFWAVDDAPTLNRVVAALTCTRNHLAKFEYVLLEKEEIEGVDLKPIISQGWSPDSELNEDRHYRITELSGKDMVKLLRLIYTQEARRFMIEDVASFIKDGLENRTLSEADVNDDVLKELEGFAP